MELKIPQILRSAILSPCGKYRYELTRWWDRKSVGKDTVCWIMLNPSTADHAKDDPTIRRCMDFSRRWGYGGMVVVNLFALRSTSPQAMMKGGWWGAIGEVRPTGEESDNDSYIRLWARECAVVVAAWGAHGGWGKRDFIVMNGLSRMGINVSCLGTTAHGHPRHPLYVKANAVLQPYRWGLGR